MRNLTDINRWQKNFGLLPTHLNPTAFDSTYLMLNGNYGNFCLQIGEKRFSAEEYYSKSWSVNTKHFVTVDSDKVKIFNWSKRRPEEIKLEQVESNFDKFYNYLLTKTYRTENDVIPFIVNIFQQFRNITLEKADPAEALNLLFVLLISIEENYTKIDTEKWNISSYHIPNGFEGFSEQLRNGYNDNIPQLDLILRHIAGTLFQEAHKQVLYFNPQLDLFGGVSNELTFKLTSYTSVHYTPKKDFKTYDYYFYLALFSSNVVESLFSIYSKQLAGGKWYNLGQKYTKNIPIPSVHDEKISTSKGYDQMIELGREFSTGNRFVKPMIDEVLLKYFYPESS